MKMNSDKLHTWIDRIGFIALAVIILALVVVGSTGCAPVDTVNKRQTEQTNQLFEDMDRVVGFPAIVNYAERRQAKRILELRDQAPPTYTYTINLEGERIFLCNSVGFGIPASVQYTNPEKRIRYNTGTPYNLPQPDPNGLFMPSGLAATYVMCVDPKGGDPTPLYVEPEIVVSTFKLD